MPTISNITDYLKTNKIEDLLAQDNISTIKTVYTLAREQLKKEFQKEQFFESIGYDNMARRCINNFDFLFTNIIVMIGYLSSKE